MAFPSLTQDQDVHQQEPGRLHRDPPRDGPHAVPDGVQPGARIRCASPSHLQGRRQPWSVVST